METLIKQIDPTKLRAARLAAELHQDMLGEKLGWGKAMVSHVETGYTLLDANQLALWAEACNVTDVNSLYSYAPPNAFLASRTQRKNREKSLT